MKEQITALFTSYLIYPILGLLLVGLSAFMAKKNGLLSNKRLITCFLATVLVLALPGLMGFLHYDFMPYGYIFTVVIYLLLGIANVRILPAVVKKKYKYRLEIVYTLLVTVIGMLFYTLLFNYANDLHYGIWASTSIFAFPLVSLLSRSIELYIRIPSKVYKVWNYASYRPSGRQLEIDYNKLNVVRVEIFKSESDRNPTNINAKAAEEMVFGDWIHMLIRDYNKRSLDSPIEADTGQEDTGWIFYVKPSALGSKRYVDYELTLAENRIMPNHLIMARRVKNIKEAESDVSE